MGEQRNITMDRGWNILLKDLQIDASNVVRRAGLSPGILTAEISHLTVDEYFRLIEAVDREADDPLLPLRFGRALSPEVFSPVVFAAMCSSTLAVAVRRMAVHKRLIAPMALVVAETDDELTVGWEWDDPSIRSPRLLAGMELAFMTQLARIATREPIEPTHVACTARLEPAAEYEEFFGVRPVVAERPSIRFRRSDAHRPFLTASEAMWKSFEPALQQRLSKLDAQTSVAERTRSTLLECLPSGEVSIDGAARRLGMSRRTLQRRLKEEGLAYRDVVKDVRERLSKHYLVNTALPYAEIAFLIGFDEPTSFFRAFREWTGTTPESMRLAAG